MNKIDPFRGVMMALIWCVPSWVFGESSLQFDDIIQMLDHSEKQFNYAVQKSKHPDVDELVDSHGSPVRLQKAHILQQYVLQILSQNL